MGVQGVMAGSDTHKGFVLAYAAWIVGEYPATLSSRHDTINSLLLSTTQVRNPKLLSAFVQAIPKLLASMVLEEYDWSQ